MLSFVKLERIVSTQVLGVVCGENCHGKNCHGKNCHGTSLWESEGCKFFSLVELWRTAALKNSDVELRADVELGGTL